MEKITKNNYSEHFRNFNLRRVESENTIEHYRKYMDLFFRYTDADFADFENVKNFTKKYEELFKIETIKNETRKKFLKISRLFADFLIENEIISENAPRKIKPPKITKPLPEFFENSDLQKIFKIILDNYSWFLAERNILIIKTLLNTWIRKSELLNLEQNHISVEKIFIKSWKWNKDRYIYLWKKFSQELQNFIQKYPNKYLFFTKNWHKLGESGLKNLFLKIKKYHPENRIFAHKFRHTYATKLLENNVDIGIIKEQLWHSSIATTANYISVSNSHRKKVLEVLEF